MPGTINIISLGCSKNLVDSEKLARQLEINGFAVEFEGNNDNYVATLINTCGFIHDAKEESIETILATSNPEVKQKYGQVIVFGCLTELYKQELGNEIPEVHFWSGKFDYLNIVDYLKGKVFEKHLYERAISTPSHYAYLKIAEGCDRTCAFCSIPTITGSYTSVPKEQLIKEARFLAKKGTKELILIAQELNSYGKDLEGNINLTDLIKDLSNIDEIQWIRLHYAYPQNLPKGLIDEIRNNPKVCKYLDIPFQHASDSVLKRMRRGHTEKTNYEIIENLRTQIPDVSLRTTLMVGFPGETDEDFQELLTFTRNARFDKMGAFAYSHEEHTISREKYTDDIEESTKQERLDELMELQYEISLNVLAEKVGQEFCVIIDRFEDGIYYARSEYESPEVDGEIKINHSDRLNIGEFYKVRITQSDAYDLYGKII